MRADLERLLGSYARLEGRKGALEARALVLERDVGLAKGRTAIKAEIEKFIEEIQTEANERNVKSYQDLLSAIVRDVLPGGRPIKLDLSIERGLPALDINVGGDDAPMEDAFEDNGGALTNVIGMGLRLIAVVKSGGAKFLTLDEGDCWIKPERVPHFYKVLRDAAAQLGVQCLLISHHDISSFDDDTMRISLVEKRADHVTVTTKAQPAVWEDAQEGFRFIRMVNVQGYRDATVSLAPGVNALIGANNLGKSTAIRALRAVFYGESRDSLIRHREKTATIEIGLAGGRLLRFSRQMRRNPVNMWSLHEADGSVVIADGARLETGGANPPDWLGRMFGIEKADQLDIHLAHQKRPVFLLNERSSVRASVLSIGQEADYAREMLAVHKERVQRDAATAREGEKEMGLLRAELERLGALPGIADSIAEVRQRHLAHEAGIVRETAIAVHEGRLTQLRAQLESLHARAEAARALPEGKVLAHLSSTLARAAAREQMAQRYLDLHDAFDVARARGAALEGLPGARPELAPTDATAARADLLERMRDNLAEAHIRHAALEGLPLEKPVLDPTDVMIARGKTIKDVANALAQARARANAVSEAPSAPPVIEPTLPAEARIKAIEESAKTLAAAKTRLETVRAELALAVDAMGGVCPTCGGEIDADGTAHRHEAA